MKGVKTSNSSSKKKERKNSSASTNKRRADGEEGSVTKKEKQATPVSTTDIQSAVPPLNGAVGVNEDFPILNTLYEPGDNNDPMFNFPLGDALFVDDNEDDTTPTTMFMNNLDDDFNFDLI
eukprot:m.4163 g.4163  ORF g.4163 m.4163 type:complete len:121 (-) comp3831_c0_seq1:132-494(-)